MCLISINIWDIFINLLVIIHSPIIFPELRDTWSLKDSSFEKYLEHNVGMKIGVAVIMSTKTTMWQLKL